MTTPSEGQAGACAEAIERLAQRLFRELENLDPGIGEFPEWGDLDEHDRELYRAAIEAVFVRELSTAATLVSEIQEMAGRAGLEPASAASAKQRSIQLS